MQETKELVLDKHGADYHVQDGNQLHTSLDAQGTRLEGKLASKGSVGARGSVSGPLGSLQTVSEVSEDRTLDSSDRMLQLQPSMWRTRSAEDQQPTDPSLGQSTRVSRYTPLSAGPLISPGKVALATSTPRTSAVGGDVNQTSSKHLSNISGGSTIEPQRYSTTASRRFDAPQLVSPTNPPPIDDAPSEPPPIKVKDAAQTNRPESPPVSPKRPKRPPRKPPIIQPYAWLPPENANDYPWEISEKARSSAKEIMRHAKVSDGVLIITTLSRKFVGSEWSEFGTWLLGMHNKHPMATGGQIKEARLGYAFDKFLEFKAAPPKERALTARARATHAVEQMKPGRSGSQTARDPESERKAAKQQRAEVSKTYTRSASFDEDKGFEKRQCQACGIEKVFGSGAGTDGFAKSEWDGDQDTMRCVKCVVNGVRFLGTKKGLRWTPVSHWSVIHEKNFNHITSQRQAAEVLPRPHTTTISNANTHIPDPDHALIATRRAQTAAAPSVPKTLKNTKRMAFAGVQRDFSRTLSGSPIKYDQTVDIDCVPSDFLTRQRFDGLTGLTPNLQPSLRPHTSGLFPQRDYEQISDQCKAKCNHHNRQSKQRGHYYIGTHSSQSRIQSPAAMRQTVVRQVVGDGDRTVKNPIFGSSWHGVYPTCKPVTQNQPLRDQPLMALPACRFECR